MITCIFEWKTLKSCHTHKIVYKINCMYKNYEWYYQCWNTDINNFMHSTFFLKMSLYSKTNKVYTCFLNTVILI